MSSPRACIPAAGVSCEFYMAVIAWRYDALAAISEFKVTVVTPQAITLVPCESESQRDSIRTLLEEDVNAPPGHTLNRYYDICTSRGTDRERGSLEHLTVSLDQCTGSTTLLACDVDPSSGVNHCPRSMPTLKNWAYLSDGNQTCTRHWEKGSNGWGKKVCTPQSKTKTPNQPSLLLPFNSSSSDARNYVVLAVGAGDFQMKLQTRDTLKLYQGTDLPAVVALKPSEFSVTWQPSLIQTPNGTFIRGNGMRPITYTAVVISSDEANNIGAHLQSQCGLQHVYKYLPPWAWRSYNLLYPREEQKSLTYTCTDAHLISEKEYFVVIVALCDTQCLRAAAIKSDPKSVCASHYYGCSPQWLVYPPVRVTLPSLPPSSSSAFGEVIIFTFWVVVTALLFMCVVVVKLMHDKGLFSDAAQGLSFGDRDAALSTPYTDSLGEETRGGWGLRGWGYAQLHFTEMVDTSTFSGRGQDGEGALGQGQRQGEGEMQGVPRPSRGAAMVGGSRRVLGSVLDGANVVLGSLASLVTSAADTASTAFSRYKAVPRESADIDNSTHPPRQEESKGRGGRNGGYRPPSPVSSPIIDLSATKIRRESGKESESVAMINIHASGDEEKDTDRDSDREKGKEKDNDKGVRDASQTYTSFHPHRDESDEGL